MKLLSSIILLLLTAVSAWAPPPLDTLWTRYQGHGSIAVALPTAENGYVLAGETPNWNVARFDSLGVLRDSILVEGIVVSACSAGGTSVITIGWGGVIHKTDLQTVLWSNNDLTSIGFSGPTPPVITQTFDGNFMAVGFGSPPFCYELITAKIDNDGDTLETHCVNSPFPFWGIVSISSIQPTADSGCVIAGSIVLIHSPVMSAFVIKFSQNGEEEWHRSYDLSYRTFGDGIAVRENSFLLTGKEEQDGSYYWYSMHLGILGDTLSTTRYPMLGGEYPCYLTPTHDGSFAITGTIHPFDSEPTVEIIKVDLLGTPIWSGALPFPNNVPYFGNDIVMLSDGNLLIVYQTMPWSLSDIYAAKIPATGTLSIDNRITQPSSFSLSAYPNPFNPMTNLSLTVPQTAQVKLKIYNVNGREVQTLFEGRLEAGEHKFSFDGANLPSGIYIANLQAEKFNATKKLLLLK